MVLREGLDIVVGCCYTKSTMFNKKEYDRKYRLEHKEEIRTYLREYHRKHRDRLEASSKRSRGKLKGEILTHYGNGECKCMKCGFSDIKALTLDHIVAIGGKRQRTRSSGYYFYVDLKRQGFPKGYQTLCSNCQRIKQVDQNEWAHNLTEKEEGKKQRMELIYLRAVRNTTD